MSNPITGFFPHPVDRSFLFGVRRLRLYASTNAGLSWHGVGVAPFPANHNDSFFVNDLLFVPGDPNQILLSGCYPHVNDDNCTPMLLASQNRGISWRVIESGNNYKFYADPNFPERGFAFSRSGIFAVERTGLKRISSSTLLGGSFTSVPGSPDEFYSVTFETLSHTTNGGRTWKDIGRPDQDTGLMDVTALSSNEVIVATQGGIRHYSPVDGWSQISHGLQGVSLVGLQSSNQGSVFAFYGVNDFLYFKESPKSPWQIKKFKQNWGLSVDPFDRRHWFRATSQGLLETQNSGKTWIRLGNYDGVFFDSVVVDHAYFAVEGSYYESKRRDEISPDPLPVYVSNVFQLLVQGANRKILYFQSTSGVYRSDDGGVTLRKADYGLNLRDLLWIAPAGPQGHFLALTSKHEVFRTVDRGDHWSLWSQVIPGLFPGQSGMILPAADPNHVFAVAKHRLFESLDAAKSWNEITDPFEDNVLSISDPSRPPLYVSTSSGVYMEQH